jgi:hypothetical protein
MRQALGIVLLNERNHQVLFLLAAGNRTPGEPASGGSSRRSLEDDAAVWESRPGADATEQK